MSTTTEKLPLNKILEPETPEELAAIVRDCAESETPVYPLGGGTCQDFGLLPTRPGLGLSLAKLNRMIDYPARDMTITVEAGLTLQSLSDTLAAEHQFLPVDLPHPAEATLGGVVATNRNGPRQFGYKSIRDHVIGIQAVDGRGTLFHGGGRVVKNVAGYDFCKLLTGSLGTLAVITQLTLKVQPRPARSDILLCAASDGPQAERALDALANSRTTPAALELLVGQGWSEMIALETASAALSAGQPLLAILLEGTEPEVEWMVSELQNELRQCQLPNTSHLTGADAHAILECCAEFPGQPAPLVLEASVVPSHTLKIVQQALEIAPDINVLAHAGNGNVILQFPEFPAEGLSRTVVGKLQPAAAAGQGNIVVRSNPTGVEATRQAVWGGNNAPYWLMQRVKTQFDPHQILNPGRFVY